MKRSEKIIVGLLTLGLLAVLTVGSTMAYMTDWEDKANTFTVGTLDIALEEKNWTVGRDGDSVMPGDTFLKDPVIKGVKNDSYVRTYVIIKDGDTGETIMNENRLSLIRSMIKFDSTYDAEKQKSGTGIVSGTGYTSTAISASPMVNPSFTAVTTNTPGEYCYTYNSILREGDSVALFTNVVVPTDWSQVQLDVVGSFSIDVVVEAIQAKNFANATAAFAALDNEIRANTIVKNYDSTQ